MFTTNYQWTLANTGNFTCVVTVYDPCISAFVPTVFIKNFSFTSGDIW